MADKSLTQYAYDVLVEAKAPVAFIDLWNACTAKAGLTDLDESVIKTMMSRFYTSLSIDGKFVCLTNNHWDLRLRHTFKEVHIDIEDAYTDDEDSEEIALEGNDEDIPEELKEANNNEDDDDDINDVDYDHPTKVIDDEF